MVEFIASIRRFTNTGRLDPSATEPIVLRVRAMFDLLLPTPEVVDISLELSRHHSLSHWDSMLLAACAAGGVETLFSEDLAHNQTYAGVTVINPFKS